MARLSTPKRPIGIAFEEDREIEVRVGISYVSTENARANLEAESAGKSFEALLAEGVEEWNELLGRVQIEGGNADDKIIFYSALYHLLLHPNILQDVNGDYPAMEGYEILNSGGTNRYTVFSLWDTYRNVHPFLCLVYPELQSEMLHSMVAMSEESGWLPKWELLGMETSVMVGDPATPVIADSYLRGIRDFDVQKAYAAAEKAASSLDNNKLRPGILYYDSLGFIPENVNGGVWGTVSTTLEYNIADWNLAQLAKALGNESDYRKYSQRALSYRNYFDAETQMLRPRMKDLNWLSPFDPEAGKNFEPVIGFVEGNAWQYRFYVPHDMPGLIQLLGGEKAFIDALNECFDTDNYDMANEPDITYPFLYNFVKGEEWRAQQRVAELVRKYYFNAPDGLPGNDDTGTLSAWLLFSMMGLYPHCPGDLSYTLTTPFFEQVEIALHPDYYSGDKLILRSSQTASEDTQICAMRWNGKKHKQFFIDHNTLVKGGELEFELEPLNQKKR